MSEMLPWVNRVAPALRVNPTLPASTTIRCKSVTAWCLYSTTCINCIHSIWPSSFAGWATQDQMFCVELLQYRWYFIVRSCLVAAELAELLWLLHKAPNFFGFYMAARRQEPPSCCRTVADVRTDNPFESVSAASRSVQPADVHITSTLCIHVVYVHMLCTQLYVLNLPICWADTCPTHTYCICQCILQACHHSHGPNHFLGPCGNLHTASMQQPCTWRSRWVPVSRHLKHCNSDVTAYM